MKRIVLIGIVFLLSASISLAQDICEGDFDCDGDVDVDDIGTFLEDFGRGQYFNPCPDCAPTSSISEPMTVTIFDNACDLQVGDVSATIDVTGYKKIFYYLIGVQIGTEIQIHTENTIDGINWIIRGGIGTSGGESIMENDLVAPQIRLMVGAPAPPTCVTVKAYLMP